MTLQLSRQANIKGLGHAQVSQHQYQSVTIPFFKILHIFRGRIFFLLSTPVQLAAGVSSLVAKFRQIHQKAKKKKDNNFMALFQSDSHIQPTNVSAPVSQQ